ncbi:unnamed protein product [Anisakis simplex]|uniref:ANF_receptor domain-containing protein n=1 Tax=Anisakis simplex TaxID=6269 RepID=A0A0M3KIF4_ANISI|nr:unnamed protein product [Anisakis simplex]
MTTVNDGFKVRVGHIGSIKSMPNSEKVLEISRKELLSDGILDDDFDIEFEFIQLVLDHFRLITKMGCGESFEGVAVATDMFHLQQVKAFIGPYCNSGQYIMSPLRSAFSNSPSSVQIVQFKFSSNFQFSSVQFKSKFSSNFQIVRREHHRGHKGRPIHQTDPSQLIDRK